MKHDPFFPDVEYISNFYAGNDCFSDPTMEAAHNVKRYWSTLGAGGYEVFTSTVTLDWDHFAVSIATHQATAKAERRERRLLDPAYRRYHSKAASKECRGCGKLFKPDTKLREFCSRDCSASHRMQRTMVECDVCGVEFLPSRVGIKRCGPKCANQSRAKRLTYNGVTLTVEEWAARNSMKPHQLHNRLRRGWPLSRALNEPLKQGKDLPWHEIRRRYEAGEKPTVISKRFPITYQAIQYRAEKEGWRAA